MPAAINAVVARPQPLPWNQGNALLFYGGSLSNFAATDGLRLPEGWYGHPRPSPRMPVRSVEHYLQACKACDPGDFGWVLAAPTPAAAKRRGSARGEGGRTIDLRPDWEQVKLAVMLAACRGKFSLPRYRAPLLATGDRTLVEDSPSDYAWGGRDPRGEYLGRNLLGIVLMEVRRQARHDPMRPPRPSGEAS